MKIIATNDHAIIISYEAAIALYRARFIDVGLLGYCLPIAIADQLCPKVHQDTERIQQVAELLQNLGEISWCDRSF